MEKIVRKSECIIINNQEVSYETKLLRIIVNDLVTYYYGLEYNNKTYKFSFLSYLDKYTSDFVFIFNYEDFEYILGNIYEDKERFIYRFNNNFNDVILANIIYMLLDEFYYDCIEKYFIY